MSGFSVPATLLGDLVPLDLPGWRGERESRPVGRRDDRPRPARTLPFTLPDSGCKRGGPSCLECRLAACVLDAHRVRRARR